VIALARDGLLWTARIDRPDKAGALTEAMLTELADIAEAARTGARVLILTGTGTVFSAGMDLEAAQSGLATSPVWERLSGAIDAHPGLTICALNGTVAGGAVGMALACDLRLAVPGAKLFYPVMKLGFLPQPSDPARLSALVGPARAKLILMGGAKTTSNEAVAWGLFDRIVEDPLAEARVLAEDALAADPAHVTAIKALIPGRVPG
jgi:enoyl-CoA hydratase/carnithine racemase